MFYCSGSVIGMWHFMAEIYKLFQLVCPRLKVRSSCIQCLVTVIDLGGANELTKWCRLFCELLMAAISSEKLGRLYVCPTKRACCFCCSAKVRI